MKMHAWQRSVCCWIVAAAVSGGMWASNAQAEPAFIQPNYDVELPIITFDNNINPISPANPFGSGLSNDALNILRAHAVAIQQVEAAVQYLRSNQASILQGKNSFYNKIFGDFYSADSEFAGSYDRTVRRPKTYAKVEIQDLPRITNGGRTEWGYYVRERSNSSGDVELFRWSGPNPVVRQSPAIEAIRSNLNPPITWEPQLVPQPVLVEYTVYDKRNNIVYEEVYNTAHFDRILETFEGIQAALQQDTNYQWGGQTTENPLPPPAPTTLDDPTLLAYAEATGQTVGDLNYGAGEMTLADAFSRGFRKWGNSTSFSEEHKDQRENDPNNSLLWYLDNALNGDAETDLTFFREKLDLYGVAGTSDVVDDDGVVTTPGTDNELYVGGAFLKEKERRGKLNDSQPNSRMKDTDLNQFQMIIASFAEMLGNGVEPGLMELFGDTPFFLQSMDSESFAKFADLGAIPGTKIGRGSFEEGTSIGDGRKLVPRGKQGTYASAFNPIVVGE